MKILDMLGLGSKPKDPIKSERIARRIKSPVSLRARNFHGDKWCVEALCVYDSYTGIYGRIFKKKTFYSKADARAFANKKLLKIRAYEKKCAAEKKKFDEGFENLEGPIQVTLPEIGE